MQTEKIDTFSLGNILYVIATEKEPYYKDHTKEAQRLVMEGTLPSLDQDFIDSDHPADKALVVAMNMCFEHDWRKRASSAEVRDFLRKELKRVNREEHRN